MGADASDDGARAERFSDVVVSAEFESEDLVDFGVAGGEEEDGDLGGGEGGLADFLAKVKAGEVGEADIEDDEVGGVGFEVEEGLVAGGEVRGVEVFGFKGVEKGVGDGGFVFNEEDGGHGGGVFFYRKFLFYEVLVK